MSANIIESFFVSLGFEIDTEKVEEFKKKTEDLRSSALKIGALFTGAAVGIGAMIMKVAEGMDDVGDFADIVGMSAREIDALGKIAKQNDSSFEAMKSTLQGLTQVTGEAAMGIGRGAMIFEKLGFSAKDAEGKTKGASDMLGEVADRMKDMSASEKMALASKLHIDPSLIPLLSKGSEAFRELKASAEAANPLTEEQYKQADEIVKLWNKATASVAGYTKLLAAKLFPIMKDILTAYNDWVSAVKKGGAGVVSDAFKLAAAFAETLWEWILRVASGVKDAYHWLTQFKSATYMAAAAVGVLIAYQVGTFFNNLRAAISLATTSLRTFIATGAAAAAPIILIGALVAAIALLIDSYVNWKEGNDSIIGDLVEQFPALLGIIKTIEDGVGSFIDFWLQQWDSLKGPLSSLAGAIWNLVTTVVSALWPVVKMVFTGWAYILAAVIPIVATLIEWIAGFLVGAIRFVVDALTWIVQAATTVFQGVVAVVQFAIDAIVAYFTWWWQTTVQIFQFIVGVIGQVVDAVMGGVKGAVDWVMGILDSAQQKVMGFIDSVVGAIGKVGQLLGLTNDASNVDVKVSKTAQAAAQAPAMQSGNSDNASNLGPASAPLASSGGVIGRAGSNVNSATSVQTVSIGAPNITINSPDPAKAGEAVRQELDKMNKQTTRNGQSAVAL